MSLQTVLYVLLWAVAFVLMMRFGCGAHAMERARQRARSPGDAGHAPGASGARSRPAQEADPVCGMSVRRTEAKTTLHEGRVYYFCSPKCREKFEATPATYVKPGPVGANPPKEHRHG